MTLVPSWVTTGPMPKAFWPLRLTVPWFRKRPPENRFERPPPRVNRPLPIFVMLPLRMIESIKRPLPTELVTVIVVLLPLRSSKPALMYGTP